MCRLFGFRSSLESHIHKSLVSAENALVDQSHKHSDGWGVAYYIDKAPHLIKSTEPAFDDRLFQKVSGIVSSETVIAHLRLATVGNLSILNAHPFQYGRWVFAHNGNIANYGSVRLSLLERIEPRMRRFILGDTDSEAIFYLLLTFIAEEGGFEPVSNMGRLIMGVRRALAFIASVAGDFSRVDASPELTYLTFILSDGYRMLAHQGGKQLYFSTHKQVCSQRDTCPAYNHYCEHEAKAADQVRHLMFASEPLHGENLWSPMAPCSIIGVDGNMKLVLE